MVVIVATVGIWRLNEPPAEVLAPETVAELEADARADRAAGSVADADAGAAGATPPAAPEESLLAEAEPPAAGRAGAGAPSTMQDRRAPLGANAAPRALPAAPPPAVALAPAPARPDAARELAAVGEDRAERFSEATSAPGAAWEAGEDVRLLSLRLQQMAETSEGLSWDAPPTPFGAADDAAGARVEGLQTVGDGPARVEVRMRTTTPARSDGQPPRP